MTDHAEIRARVERLRRYPEGMLEWEVAADLTALLDENERLRDYAKLLLANLDWIIEVTDESLESDDDVIVEDIRQALEEKP